MATRDSSGASRTEKEHAVAGAGVDGIISRTALTRGDLGEVDDKELSAIVAAGATTSGLPSDPVTMELLALFTGRSLTAAAKCCGADELAAATTCGGR